MGDPTTGSQRDRATVVGTAIAILTLIVAAVSAVPSFISLHQPEPRVVYVSTTARMVYLPGEEFRVRSLLESNNLPDATTSIEVVNRGAKPATRVNIHLLVDGKITAVIFTPPVDSKPPWVTVNEISDYENTPSELTVSLENLGVGPKFEISVSYRRRDSEDRQPDWSVFSDGLPATRVDSLLATDESSPAAWYSLPAAIMVGGLVLMAIVTAGFRMRRYPILRLGFVTAFKTMLPFVETARVVLDEVSTSTRDWKAFRDAVVLALKRQAGVRVVSCVDGEMGTSDPEMFWDLILEAGARRVCVNFHVSAQDWFKKHQDDASAVWYVSRLLAMADRAKATPFVAADSDIWSVSSASKVVALLRSLPSPGIACVWGSPEAVAAALLETEQPSENESGSVSTA